MEDFQSLVLKKLDTLLERTSNAPPAEVDPWRSYFQCHEDYEEAVAMAQTCRKPVEVKDRVITPLHRKGYHLTEMNTVSFVKCLANHLINYGGSKEIRSLQRSIF